MTTMTAVLGSSGQIGSLVVGSLVAAGQSVRACSRTAPAADRPGVDERQLPGYTRSDLTAALDGCSAVIATIGLPYRAQTWLDQWPPLVESIASACADLAVPLTLLDNVYLYGDAPSPLTEDSPLRPCSRKGQARLEGWTAIRRRIDDGQDIVVCRAADFLGPGAQTTILPWRFVTGCLDGTRRSLPWMGSADAQHSFSFTGEIADALVRISSDTRFRAHPVIHLPVLQPFSGRQLADALTALRGTKIAVRALPGAVISVAAWFSQAAREQKEMWYQVERDFIVSDDLIRGLGWRSTVNQIDEVLANAVTP